MLSIRIDTGRATLAAVLFAASMTAGSALAQTVGNGAPGKPLQLVQNIKRASKTVATKSTKTAAKTKATHHRTFARRKRPPAPVQVAQEPADAWPAAPATLPFAGTAAAPSPVPAETAPNELVVGGQTVQISPPDQFNEIDLAAKNETAATDAASPKVSPEVGNDVAEPAAKTDLANAAPPPAMGSTAWLLQVLAALGGAVAAGSAAWLLIGSAPQRMYG